MNYAFGQNRLLGPELCFAVANGN